MAGSSPVFPEAEGYVCGGACACFPEHRLSDDYAEGSPEGLLVPGGVFGAHWGAGWDEQGGVGVDVGEEDEEVFGGGNCEEVWEGSMIVDEEEEG